MSWEKEYNDPDILNPGVCWPLVWIMGLLFLCCIIKFLFNEGVL